MPDQNYLMEEPVGQMNRILKEPFHLLPCLLDASQLNCFVFSMSSDGTLHYVSDSVNEILGLSSEELLGRPFDEFLSESPSNDSIRNRCWTSLPGGSVTKCRCELITSDHQRIPVVMHNLGVYEDDTMIGMLGIVQPELTSDQTTDSSKAEERARAKQLASQLSKTEREVVELVVAGHMNKSMAKMLGVAVRTIEARRARAMSKLQVRSLPDLVKTWLLVEPN